MALARKFGSLWLAAAGGVLAGGCSPAPDSGAPYEVVGQSIPRPLFESYALKISGSPSSALDDAYRQRLLTDLAKLQAAAQRAEETLSGSAESEGELARLEALARLGAREQGVFADATVAELDHAYREYVARNGSEEYHVAHILVATQANGVALIDQLAAGANFSALARSASLDGSRSKGGDIGWSRPSTLPKEMWAAVRNLPVGEYTPSPIQTAYGWHVIKLLDTRPAPALPLAAVKSQLELNIRETRYRAFLNRAIMK